MSEPAKIYTVSIYNTTHKIITKSTLLSENEECLREVHKYIRKYAIDDINKSWYFKVLPKTIYILLTEGATLSAIDKLKKSQYAIMFNRTLNCIDNIEYCMNRGLGIMNLYDNQFRIVIPPSLAKCDIDSLIRNFMHNYRGSHLLQNINFECENLTVPSECKVIKISVSDSRNLSEAAKCEYSTRILNIINMLWEELSILYDNKVLGIDTNNEYQPITSPVKEYKGNLILNSVEYTSNAKLMTRLLATKYKMFSNPLEMQKVIYNYASKYSVIDDNENILQKFISSSTVTLNSRFKIKIPTEQDFDNAPVLIIPSEVHIRVTKTQYEKMAKYMELDDNYENPFVILQRIAPMRLNRVILGANNGIVKIEKVDMEQNGKHYKLRIKLPNESYKAYTRLAEYTRELIRNIAVAIIEIQNL